MKSLLALSMASVSVLFAAPAFAQQPAAATAARATTAETVRAAEPDKGAEPKKAERTATLLLKVGGATAGANTDKSGPYDGGFTVGLDALYGWKALTAGASFYRAGGSDALYNGSLLVGASLREEHVILRFLLEGGVHQYSVGLLNGSQGGGVVAFLGGRFDASYLFGDEKSKVRPEVGVGLLMQEDLATKHVNYTLKTTDAFTGVTTTSEKTLRVGGSSAALTLNIGARFNL